MRNLVNDIILGETDSAYIDAPFDEGKFKLGREGYEVISLRDNAMLRIQEGYGAEVSKEGNWTREGVLYLPDGRILLTKNNPMMHELEEATFYLTLDRNREYLGVVPDSQVQYALEDAVDLNGGAIPTNRFGEDPRTVFAFEDLAEDYGTFLNEGGIKNMLMWLEQIQNEAFVRPLRLESLGYESSFYGCYSRESINSVLFKDRVRGIKKK